MSDAKNNPVSTGKKEMHTSDVKVGQREPRRIDVITEDNEPMVALADGIGSSEEAYLKELAFMEEPVTIRINISQEKNPARVVPCWVNGKGAELFTNGKWMQNGWLPVGIPVITRRKYVEVLARAKQEGVSTRVVEMDGGMKENYADRNANMRHSFSVISDTNPRGPDWLSTILMEK